MKKLTDVTAFAYLNRETSTQKPTEDTAKNDSDDEEPSFTNFLVQKLLDAKDAVMNYMQSTVWEVYFEQSYQVVNENINLLGEYKKVIKEWEYVENPSNDQKQNVVEDMNQKFRKEYDRLRKNTEKKMKIEGVDITCADMVVKFVGVNDEQFHYKPIFPIEFLCSDAGINTTIRTSNVDRVTLLWGQKKITFKKASQDRTDEIEASMNTGNAGLWSMLTGSNRQ
jgi:hypothetical protein